MSGPCFSGKRSLPYRSQKDSVKGSIHSPKRYCPVFPRDFSRPGKMNQGRTAQPSTRAELPISRSEVPPAAVARWVQGGDFLSEGLHTVGDKGAVSASDVVAQVTDINGCASLRRSFDGKAVFGDEHWRLFLVGPCWTPGLPSQHLVSADNEFLFTTRIFPLRRRRFGPGRANDPLGTFQHILWSCAKRSFAEEGSHGAGRCCPKATWPVCVLGSAAGKVVILVRPGIAAAVTSLRGNQFAIWEAIGLLSVGA